MSITICTEGLGKKYTLSHQRRERYFALRDILSDSVRRWRRKVFHPFVSRKDSDPTHEDFWALKDVSFKIYQGDRVGIIGRNGAGKSTLLKILSRITEPSEGRISIHGRVASLLEVGTGFHPELTGRENIYLNGAILGMSKTEIKSNFDEIVAFAEVDRFLDTPVKRYSSGMYVRLAFAVAAHLEPEILVVDEVLAVGDAQFQKKCLGKMGEVGKDGRTVLFVSHNMAAISALCSKVIVLNRGNIEFDGNVKSGIDHYLDFAEHVKGYADRISIKSNLRGVSNTFSKLLSIETLDDNNTRQSVFRMGGCLKIRICLEITDDRKDIELGLFIRDKREVIAGLLTNTIEGFHSIKKGINDFIIRIPEIYLMPGEYSLGFWILHQRLPDDSCENAITFDVVSDNITNSYVDYERFREYGSVIRSSWNSATSNSNHCSSC